MNNRNFLHVGIFSLIALTACTNENSIPSAAISTKDNPSGQIKSEEPQGNPANDSLKYLTNNQVIAIDSLHTLDRYTAQFTDDANELSFDSHVLAYNGSVLSSAIMIQVSETKAVEDIPSWPIFETTADNVAKYFPASGPLTSKRMNQSNCKFYTVMVNDGGQPTGHVLTKISSGSVEVTSVNMGGEHPLTSNYFPVAFLVQDCEGLIDENSEITHKSFTSRTWCTNKRLRMISDKEDKHDSICNENAHTDASTYGEWYNSNLIAP